MGVLDQGLQEDHLSQAVGLACRETRSGVEFDVRVKPGARRSAVVGPYGSRLKLEVAAPPADGKANRALRKLLAKELGVKMDDVEVLRGAGSRDKTVLVRGVTMEAVSGLAGPSAPEEGR